MKEHESDEMEIISVIQAFQPSPTEQFYRQIAAMPWNVEDKRPIRRWLLVAASITLIVAAFLTVPPLRTLAQDVIDSLFNRADGDAKTNTYIAVAPDAEYDPYSSLEQAAAQTSFPVSTPTIMPDGYFFEGAVWDSDQSAIFLSYIYGGGGRSLQITETTHAEIFREIGASTNIENVQIGDLTGEYVEGEWVVYDRPQGEAGETVTEEATWNPTAPSRRLRWQHGDITYEIWALGGSEDDPAYIGKEAMIEIAESMQ